jgi:hypothetical protein
MRLPNSREPSGRCIDNGGIVVAAGVAGVLLGLGSAVSWFLIAFGTAMFVGGLWYLAG